MLTVTDFTEQIDTLTARIERMIVAWERFNELSLNDPRGWDEMNATHRRGKSTP